ncbi:MAG TPA: cation diffusion facilitator family transporter [Acidimicrobiales bacterium]|nr:cation diffusion facilitator family transporter [Acidimicrobiales bacterium]
MTAHHHHDHGAHVTVARHTQRRALWISLGANAGFLVAEVIGGLAFHSLALLADAAHMLSDVVGLGIALIAQQLMDRRATARHSYGLQRAEVLGAQANGITLLVVAGWVIFEAIQRLGEPADVSGRGLLLVAMLGLLVNIGSAVLLARSAGQSLNMRGAFIHMSVDAAGSVAAVIAGVAVIAWDANWVDPAASIVIAVLVLWSAWGLLRDTAQVLLEGTPRGMDPADVEAALATDGAVEAVHHLHLWNLASDVPAMSAHIVLRGDDVTLHEAQASGDRLKALLDDRFGIAHATLELECHPCEPDAIETEPAHGH